MIRTTKWLLIKHTKRKTLGNQGLRLNPIVSRAVSLRGIRGGWQNELGYIPKLARPSGTYLTIQPVNSTPSYPRGVQNKDGDGQHTN